MKNVFNINKVSLLITTTIMLVCVGCGDSSIEDEILNNETNNLFLYSEWGASKEQVKEIMAEYTLDNEEEDFLYFSNIKTSEIISYEFYEGKLCTSLLMIDEQKIDDSVILNIVSEYKEIGGIADRVIYLNEGENTLATYGLEIDDNTTYMTLGLTQLDFVGKTYEIGEHYNENGKEGVVFWVDESGEHGKIVSLTHSDQALRWCTEAFMGVSIGANDENDGSKNMEMAKQISGWHYELPAFAWCDDLGNDWYLPSINELKSFTCDDYVRNAINQTLDDVGIPIPQNDNYVYWSSTEYSRGMTYYVYFWSEDYLYSYFEKRDKHHVRAVSTF